jgi:hypothetical protein
MYRVTREPEPDLPTRTCLVPRPCCFGQKQGVATLKSDIRWFLADPENCAPVELKIPRTSGRAEFPSGIVGGVGAPGRCQGRHVVSTCFPWLVHTHLLGCGWIPDRPRVGALWQHSRPRWTMDGDASALSLLSPGVVCRVSLCCSIVATMDGSLTVGRSGYCGATLGHGAPWMETLLLHCGCRRT